MCFDVLYPGMTIRNGKKTSRRKNEELKEKNQQQHRINTQSPSRDEFKKKGEK